MGAMFAARGDESRRFRTEGRTGGWLRIIVAILAGLTASACTTYGAPYAPQSSFTAQSDFDALKKEFASDTSITEYYSEPETKQRRNEFIAGRLVLYDLAYTDWISRFRFGRAFESTILDTATLGITQAITIFGGARTKEVLGAIAASIKGTRSSYEKNFYDEQAAAAITAQMNAERKSALVPIMAGTKAEVDEYPLTAALIDLTNYQYAGTIDGALAGIHREAGIKETKAMAQLDQYRDGVFGADDFTTRLRKYVYPGMVSYSDGKALDASGNAIDANPDKVKEVRAEIAKIEPNLARLPWGVLLNLKELASLRARIVENLQIP
jgi:ribosomal protein L18